jgi:hypothetical protein
MLVPAQLCVSGGRPGPPGFGPGVQTIDLCPGSQWLTQKIKRTACTLQQWLKHINQFKYFSGPFFTLRFSSVTKRCVDNKLRNTSQFTDEHFQQIFTTLVLNGRVHQSCVFLFFHISHVDFRIILHALHGCALHGCALHGCALHGHDH